MSIRKYSVLRKTAYDLYQIRYRLIDNQCPHTVFVFDIEIEK